MGLTKKERALFVLKKLQELYPNPSIPLKHHDPFTLLVAVLLSAQCTDQRVNLVTPKLFSLADTPKKMMNCKEKEVYEIIKSCGLGETKSKNIVALSKILVSRFNGEVPSTLEELETLPGVGHKTASVVIIQAFGGTAFPVDTHIHRLAKRWGLSSGKSVEITEKDLKSLFPKESWAKLHLQMIYYGREYCVARGHDDKICPICKMLNG